MQTRQLAVDFPGQIKIAVIGGNANHRHVTAPVRGACGFKRRMRFANDCVFKLLNTYGFALPQQSPMFLGCLFHLAVRTPPLQDRSAQFFSKIELNLGVSAIPVGFLARYGTQ